VNVPSLPEPVNALVGQIIENQHPPALWEVMRALDVLRLEHDQATKRADALRQELPRLKKEYRRVNSMAFLSQKSGTQKERDHRATMASLEQQFAVDVCEESIKSAREYLNTVEKQSGLLQSIGAAIREEMRALSGFGGGT
jgi:chromosome segregation ATPase